jgi:hypothetical protein
VSWADLMIGEYHERMDMIDKTSLDAAPTFRAHYQRVHQLPHIAAYVAHRTKTLL